MNKISGADAVAAQTPFFLLLQVNTKILSAQQNPAGLESRRIVRGFKFVTARLTNLQYRQGVIVLHDG